MGQVFFFLVLDGAIFFFKASLFLTLVSKWNLDKQNITCIYIKYVVVCVYCEQFVLFLSKYCYQYSFNLFEERTSCFTK